MTMAVAAALSVWVGVELVVGEEETPWGGDAEDDDLADLAVIVGGEDIIRLTVSIYRYIEYLILLRILFV